MMHPVASFSCLACMAFSVEVSAQSVPIPLGGDGGGATELCAWDEPYSIDAAFGGGHVQLEFCTRNGQTRMNDCVDSPESGPEACPPPEQTYPSGGSGGEGGHGSAGFQYVWNVVVYSRATSRGLVEIFNLVPR